MSSELENALAKKFIQRKDVYAEQSRKGEYHPVRSPWTRDLLTQHLSGAKSLGHYLVDEEGKTKLFAFDIDLAKGDKVTVERTGRQPMWVPIREDGMTDETAEPRPCDPRAAWLHPKCPPELKRYLTAQLMGIAHHLAKAIDEQTGLPVAVAYSGNKGVHVYGFTGSIEAEEAQAAAIEVIKFYGVFEPLRGKCFFKPVDDSPYTGFPCIEVEVFPKQVNLDGKDLGNLMRLPMGTNIKSGQRARFLGLASHVDEMSTMDALHALEGDPWEPDF